MIKIILIGCEGQYYAVIKSVVSQLDFLFESDLKFARYENEQKELKEEILNCEHKKVYLIHVGIENQDTLFKWVKFIRDNDWNSEIILLKEEAVHLNKSWQKVCRIFTVIDINVDFGKVLRNDLKMILDHLCEEKTFRYKNRDMNLSIYFGRILYIYRDTKDRKVVIVTDTNTYTLNIGLKDTFCLLDERFRQVHRACVVNAMRAEKFDWNKNSFTLDNGREIDMLSKHYKDNISDFIDF